MTLRVHLPAPLCKKAAEWAAAIVPKLPSSPNPTALVRDDRFYVGYLGELALVRALSDASIGFKYHNEQSGRSETEEFVIHTVDGSPCVVEVKTASQAGYRFMMMPAVQYEHSASIDGLLYVGARIARRVLVPDGEEAYVDLMGWADQDLMLAHSIEEQVHVLTRKIAFDRMWPIEELVQYLQRIGATAPAGEPS